MRRKLPWPFVILIICSFGIGAFWGWKVIRDRAAAESLEAETKLRLLAPPGIFSHELLLEFQRQEKIAVELSVETFPASLLRRALKSAPGQYDAVLLFHHQTSALRAERKLASLYDTRIKFPTTVAPDFRKLPNDRNLMDTAPLLWGLLGVASKKEFETAKMKAMFWPSFLIGMDDIGVSPSAFASKMQPSLGDYDAHLKDGLGLFAPPASPVLVSHAMLETAPYKGAGLKFGAIHSDGHDYYPLWILTLAGLSEGDLERTRKFVRFLLEPEHNIALIQAARIGATTLREQEKLETLPKSLQASFFRTFPIDQILLERDERLRNADDVLEQMLQGANLKGAKPVETAKPTPRTARVKAPSPPPSASEDHSDAGEEEGSPTAPSEQQSHGD